jgi:hypothetical protein
MGTAGTSDLATTPRQHGRIKPVFTLRATAKLLKRLKAMPDPSPPPSTGRLGAWYANLLVVRPAQLVLCVSERTLLPVLVPAKDISSLPQRLAIAAGEMLRAIGVPEVEVIRELRQMVEWRIAKTASRQVLGSMNDFAWMAEVDPRETMSLLDRALLLAESPCKPIGMDNPRQATVALFGEGRVALRLVE